MSGADRREVLRYRQERAWLIGLCGVRFSYLGVCDEPAGHEPVLPPLGDHAETIGGPLGSVLDELYR